MLMLVKIVVIVVLLLVLFLFTAAVFFVRWIRRVLKAANHTPTCPPCRVYPEPEPNPQWRTPDKIRQYASEFRALGFAEVGGFMIPQIDGLQMLAFVHPAERLYGIIYDHKAIPPTFDIFCGFEDKTGLTASSSKAGRSLDKRPGHPILWLGDNRVAVVLDALRREPQSVPRVPSSSDDFLPTFKRHYAEGMNWRMKKGGVSREEIRRQAESKGKKLDEDVINDVYKNMRQAHITELQRGCLAQFLDEQQIPAAEWERQQARAVVIPETLETNELVEVLEGALPLDQEQRHTLRQLRGHTGQRALDTMDEILAQNVGALGLEKLGEVQEPVRAYVLLMPAREDAVKALAACS